MIRLGYTIAKNEKGEPIWFAGDTTLPPIQGRTNEIVADKALAERQLADIQAYLTRVQRLLLRISSHHRKRSAGPKEVERYASNEARALSIREFTPRREGATPEYRLHVDYAGASKRRKAFGWNDRGRRRGMHRPSWLLERLSYLARSRTPVDVWFVDTSMVGGHLALHGGETGARFKGQRYHPDYRKGSEDPPKPAADCTRSWVVVRKSYQRLKHDADIRGEVYVHELIIHGWRNLQFGYVPVDRPSRWGKLKWAIVRPHAAAGHALGSSREQHSLADVEADFLSWYLFQDMIGIRSKRRKGYHDEAQAIIALRGKLKPPLDIYGRNWFSNTGLKQRIAQRSRWL